MKKMIHYNLAYLPFPIVILWAFIGIFLIYLFNLNPGIKGIKEIILFGFLWGVFGGGFLLYFRSSKIGIIGIILGTLWCFFEIILSGKNKNDALTALILFFPMVVILEVFGWLSNKQISSGNIEKIGEKAEVSNNNEKY